MLGNSHSSLQFPSSIISTAGKYITAIVQNAGIMAINILLTMALFESVFLIGLFGFIFMYGSFKQPEKQKRRVKPIFYTPTGIQSQNRVGWLVMDNVADVIALVHQHHFGLMCRDFRLGQHHIGHNNHNIPRLHQTRRRAV